MSKTVLHAWSSNINVLEDNTLITTKYTEYVESLLSPDHQTWQHVGDKDDGADNKDLTGTSPLLRLEYTAEGSIGLIDTTLSSNYIKNSGNSYGRMYYNTREPDNQIIARFNSDDQYFEALYVSWDSNYVITTMRLRTRSYTYRYTILFVFDIKANDFKHVYIQNQTNFVTYYNFIYGIKRYNRSAPEFRTTSIGDAGNFASVFNNTNLKELITTDAELEFSYKTTNLITYIKKAKAPLTYINADTRQISYKNIGDYTEKDNILYNFSFDFFIEGRTGDIPVTVTCLLDNNKSDRFLLKNNQLHSIKSLKSSYLITTQDGYYKLITLSNHKMSQGEIIGTISTNKCNAPAGALYVLCYREDDNFLIGKYPVNNGAYEIPNLDCNSFYNIILVDSSRTLEWMVSSHRKPNPYNELVEDEYEMTTINKFYTEYDMYGKRVLKWNISNNNVDYFNLYITSVEITAEINLDFFQAPLKIKSLSYEIPATDTREYYALEAVYKDKTSERLQIRINTIVDNTKLIGVFSE